MMGDISAARDALGDLFKGKMANIKGNIAK
jgi:hypothetical protein